MRRKQDWINAIAAIIIIVLQTLIAEQVKENEQVIAEQKNVIVEAIEDGDVNVCPK